jgi:GntR family transcriptional repressor for pyruvate dehydrogenase complex
MNTPAKSLSRRSLADQVADALAQYILEEGLQEGDSLPSTAELAERFDVSRTVVREALADLAGRGVLTRSQGRESIVATPGSSELTSLLQFRLRRSDMATDDIFECRSALELTTARGAALRATPEDVAELWDLLAALDAAKGDKGFHAADIALHRGIAVASGNSLVVLILDALVDLLREVRITATRNRKAGGGTLEEVIEQHRRIVQAIADGDAEGATAAMAAHLTSTKAAHQSRGKAS